VIAILDYGAGNLRSVQNTLAEIGADYELAADRSSLERASKIVLPGVGHFGQMMRAIERLSLRAILIDRIRAGVPFLGICLGLQALFEASEEAPECAGFGLFPGMIRRFPESARVPHMGWNSLAAQPGSRLLQGVALPPYVYFAHSYYAPETSATAATCDYNVRYTAVLEADNVYGVQFHPEKSGPLGLHVMRNFVQL
jgi:glutamine amidotransferase